MTFDITVQCSQGSVVTHLRCGGIFSNDFITKISTECAGEKIEIWPIFGEDTDTNLWLTFWPTRKFVSYLLT